MLEYYRKMNKSLLRFIAKDKIEDEIKRRTESPTLPYTDMRYSEKSILRNSTLEDLKEASNLTLQ